MFCYKKIPLSPPSRVTLNSQRAWCPANNTSIVKGYDPYKCTLEKFNSEFSINVALHISIRHLFSLIYNWFNHTLRVFLRMLLTPG